MEHLPDRRNVLRAIGGLGLGALVAACGGGSSGSDASSTTRTTGRQRSTTTLAPATGSGEQVACVLAPEVTEGPYYLDLNMVRSDITDGRPGAPLALTLTVADATTCSPIANSAVDIWHADPEGVYSGFDQGKGATFLRGTQVTGADGKVTFNTLFPGWYRGRAVHIHIKVHVGGSVVHTGQLFFPDRFTEGVYTRSPYSSRGNPDMRNADDSIYADAGGATAIVTPTTAGDGYAGSTTLGVRTT
jgi:protocatechuate 3,4-dioxygenase beta subunit